MDGSRDGYIARHTAALCQAQQCLSWPHCLCWSYTDHSDPVDTCAASLTNISRSLTTLRTAERRRGCGIRVAGPQKAEIKQPQTAEAKTLPTGDGGVWGPELVAAKQMQLLWLRQPPP